MIIRDAAKYMVVKAGLPANRFSSHSLRKGGVTQLSALGSSSEDKRDLEITRTGPRCSTRYTITLL